MEFFKALGRWFKRADKKAADAITDVVEDSAMEIADAKKNVDSIRQAIAKYMAERTKVSKQIEIYKAEIKKYNDAANKALDLDKEDAARQALQLVEENQSLLDSSQARIKRMDVDIENMKKKLKKHQNTIRDAECNQKKLAAQHQMNQARKNLSDANAKFDNVSGSFDSSNNKLKEMVESQEAELDAMDELSQDPADELEELMTSSSVDDKLAALKAKRDKTKK